MSCFYSSTFKYVHFQPFPSSYRIPPLPHYTHHQGWLRHHHCLCHRRHTKPLPPLQVDFSQVQLGSLHQCWAQGFLRQFHHLILLPSAPHNPLSSPCYSLCNTSTSCMTLPHLCLRRSLKMYMLRNIASVMFKKVYHRGRWSGKYRKLLCWGRIQMKEHASLHWTLLVHGQQLVIKHQCMEWEPEM